jgi:hypothetical protein
MVTIDFVNNTGRDGVEIHEKNRCLEQNFFDRRWLVDHSKINTPRRSSISSTRAATEPVDCHARERYKE